MQLLRTSKFDVLEVHGNAHDRGFAYGEHHRTRLTRHLQSHYDFYATYFETSKDELLREASKYSEPLRAYSQDVWDELKGTADGAGISADEVMVITAFNELFYPRFEKLCTSFAIRGEATGDGLTYVGQNNDEGVDPWMNGECVTLTRHLQATAPNVLIYTYVGAPAMMGINSQGLGVCINALAYKSPRIGVPSLAVVREVLNQNDLDGAIREIQRADRAFALNFTMATPSEIADAEAYPDKVFIRNSGDMLWHTNHCLYSPGFKYESEESHKNSVTRCNRVEALLEAGKGRLGLDTLKVIMADHENKPDSICLHVNSAKPKPKQERTLDGMIFIPERKEAWIAHGNPCEVRFEKYAV
jgi:hypothetical protein